MALGQKSDGRRPGTPDRATAEAKGALEVLAREHSSAAMATLAHVAAHGHSENARVAAAVPILDRCYGRPRQALDLQGSLDVASENEHMERLERVIEAFPTDELEVVARVLRATGLRVPGEPPAIERRGKG
ncbi:MAG TPA: hypothetical protein VKI44_37175 [Acetobacteraceae bacterium]|nr:hypothetical protein [Acetobacteraceae bacterium]